MTINEARLIREIKKRATYRGLTTIYYAKSDPFYENQKEGEELCIEAFKVLYPNSERHPFDYMYNDDDMDEEFNEENKSYIGNFYWWE